jgi:hypothetical protein
MITEKDKILFTKLWNKCSSAGELSEVIKITNLMENFDEPIATGRDSLRHRATRYRKEGYKLKLMGCGKNNPSEPKNLMPEDFPNNYLGSMRLLSGDSFKSLPNYYGVTRHIIRGWVQQCKLPHRSYFLALWNDTTDKEWEELFSELDICFEEEA